ncbi:MAG: phytanoyl-CoA dioxygenase family protein [Cyanobacteriota bacterium]|nr:phytanoyl-CoA dioxygenase family protein [Cyanobacteriota bacterium]
MALNLTGQPLIDQPDFTELLASGQFGPWEKEAVSFHTEGFCILDLRESDFLERVEAVVQDLKPRLREQLILWKKGKIGPPRLQDGWQEHDSIRALALEPIILDLLRHLYGREPFAFQTLNFAVGSEQPFHSDAVHFHSYPLGFMCGVWIALQNVRAISGPLIYYPGSHRLPYLSAESLRLHPDDVATEPHPQRFFQDHWQDAVEEFGFTRKRFLPARGQVLIWHANLLHGGEPVQQRGSRRWSQVTHYFFSDCLYTTPLRSFRPAEGGPCFRNPYDIATGERRYNKKDWEALGLTAAQGHKPPPSRPNKVLWNQES